MTNVNNTTHCVDSMIWKTLLGALWWLWLWLTTLSTLCIILLLGMQEQGKVSNRTSGVQIHASNNSEVEAQDCESDKESDGEAAVPFTCHQEWFVKKSQNLTTENEQGNSNLALIRTHTHIINTHTDTHTHTHTADYANKHRLRIINRLVKIENQAHPTFARNTTHSERAKEEAHR